LNHFDYFLLLDLKYISSYSTVKPLEAITGRLVSQGGVPVIAGWSVKLPRLVLFIVVFVVGVTVCIAKWTIIWARATIIKPTTAYRIVFLAPLAASGLPALVIYRKPPTIIIITAAIPAAAERILTTVLIVVCTEPVEAPGLQTTFPLESTEPAALQAPHSICCLALRLEVSEQEIPAADAKLMNKPPKM